MYASWPVSKRHIRQRGITRVDRILNKLAISKHTMLILSNINVVKYLLQERRKYQRIKNNILYNIIQIQIQIQYNII